MKDFFFFFGIDWSCTKVRQSSDSSLESNLLDSWKEEVCEECARGHPLHFIFSCMRVFPPPYFSCPFCRFSIFVFLPWSFGFSTLSRKWKHTLFVLQLRHLFFKVLWPFSQRNCQIVEDVWTTSEQLVKSKDIKRQTKETPRSRWPFFYKLSEKCYQKSCKYVRNNSTRLKGKNTST